MGKENKDRANEEPKKNDDAKKQEKPNKSKANDKEASPESLLAKLRPKTRSIFFIGWLTVAAWTLFIYDPCNIPSKNRKDCGYPDISAGECRTIACFLKNGGSALAKKTVKVKRKEGSMLGFEVEKKDKWGVVTSIADGGAIKEHNAEAADADDAIRVGDRVAKIDGKGSADMAKVLKATSAKAVTVDVLRPKLPSYLMWISSQKTSAPNWAEKVLTAPGFKQWSIAFSYFGGAGMMCWLLSGYPLASLPVYYIGVSAAVSFGTMRCCHDDSVAGGVAHCYKPKHTDFVNEIVPKIREDTIKFFSKIRKDPQAWFKKTFMT